MSGQDFDTDTTNKILNFIDLCKSDADDKYEKQKTGNKYKNCNNNCKQGGNQNNGRRMATVIVTCTRSTPEVLTHRLSAH